MGNKAMDDTMHCLHCYRDASEQENETDPLCNECGGRRIYIQDFHRINTKMSRIKNLPAQPG